MWIFFQRLLAPDKLERTRAMKPLADELGCTRAQLALAWTAAQPSVSSVITGASRVDQLLENLGDDIVEFHHSLSCVHQFHVTRL